VLIQGSTVIFFFFYGMKKKIELSIRPLNDIYKNIPDVDFARTNVRKFLLLAYNSTLFFAIFAPFSYKITSMLLMYEYKY